MRIVIGEDEALLRQGLTTLLELAGHQVVGAVADAEELVRLVGTTLPDLVVTDIRMPPGHAADGLVAAGLVVERWPDVAVVVLSQHVHRRAAMDLLDRRGTGIGYLLKQRVADITTFCATLERVRAGETVLDPEVVSLMVARARRDDSAVDRLTSRQREVLALIAEGRANLAIGEELHITEKSVVAHVSHIYDALGIAATPHDHRRVLAVIRYLSHDGDRPPAGEVRSG